jgi:eukaryotic-like serine/threonine-protein kinase
MEINKRIGDYEILGELGQGGMGRVYRVRNVIADRVEAMKVLLPDLAGRQDLAARFLREIKVLAALNHPNIAALRTALTAGNQLVMIMEYVEGQSLAERLVHGPIATPDALSYIDQVLDALTYAHGRGVVHRDIKPANMMLTASGVVKLTDFGIARSTTDETITVAGTTTGSLSYMAPEQINGDPSDARSDLYSVGISLYEMVTGQRPFRADNDFHVMLAHLKEEPRPPLELQPSLPPALNGIILRAIAKHPGARFQSAHEFREALAGVTARGSATTASRQATVLISTSGQAAAVEDLGRPASASWGTPAGSATEHPRTVLDTRTPVAPHAAMPYTAPGSTSGAQPAVMRSGHPLLFVALGAALVIAALVGTGLYLGRAEAGPGRTTEAATQTDPAAGHTPPVDPAVGEGTAVDAGGPAGGTPPSAGPDAVPAAPQPEGPSAATVGAAPAGPTPAGASLAAPAPSGPRSTVAPEPPRPPAPPLGSERVPVQPAAGAAAAPPAVDQPVPPAPAQPATPPAAVEELEAIDGELDQLAARAAAVTSTLERLKEQQARQGFGLRGDIVARHESMRINLARAQEAVDKSDVGRAQKFRDTAQRDIEALEQFLGR